VLDGPPAPDLNIQELENELILTISNPQGSTNANEDYIEFDPFIVADSAADKNYRFQGYQIFQLADNDVALSDLEDPTKARLVAQCDKKDGIGRIINFEFEEGLGASIPVEKVDGADEGLRHSFRVTEDLFALGDKQLVNFKRYYYMAISYAYNNYKDYDPNDPLQLDGQQKPYIASRKAAIGEVKVMEGIPHNPMPEADGTGQNIAYGSTPQITRIDGHGNGGRVLEFTNETMDQVITAGKVDNPVYDYGAGPINVKVIDPLNVAKGYFQLKFRDYTAGPTLNGYDRNIDTAQWVLYRFDSQGGSILDSITSNYSISVDNEQLIPEWGVSVQINQKYYYTPEAMIGVPTYFTDLLEASISFADSSKPWLSFIRDDNGFFPSNWIRSGDYFPDSDPISSTYECLDNTLPEYRDYLDPCFYPDQIGADPERDWDNILGGGIAPHRLAGYEASYQPMAYYNYPAVITAKKRSEISYLPSVDIVITSDKSKWTRCPVIETGRDPLLNVGGAEPGAMRKSPSVDKNGNSLNDGTTGMGWFPGYAIDLESGVRLYMAFGENSFLTSDNGADMIWNPSERIVDNSGNPIMGGVQPIYIFNYNVKTINNYALQYDYKPYYPWEGESLSTNQAYQDMLLIEGGDNTVKRNFYSSISWVLNPRLTPGQQNLGSDVTIRLRVSKEYTDYVATGINGGRPMYSWSMDDVGTDIESRDRLAEAIDLINVVPNPYNAYSEYEKNRLDSRVKITNLPERCTVTIYDSRGKLVKQFKKDSPQTYQDWLLTNHAGIPVASGVYLIHVEVRNETGEVIGHKIVKSFIAMRQVDLQNI
ncbi:MAG: T9SS type A sorting domain-containing protein, partial [Crocinitomicaceae bacterium]